jgi:hypothetical protein
MGRRSVAQYLGGSHRKLAEERRDGEQAARPVLFLLRDEKARHTHVAVEDRLGVEIGIEQGCHRLVAELGVHEREQLVSERQRHFAAFANDGRVEVRGYVGRAGRLGVRAVLLEGLGGADGGERVLEDARDDEESVVAGSAERAARRHFLRDAFDP